MVKKKQGFVQEAETKSSSSSSVEHETFAITDEVKSNLVELVNNPDFLTKDSIIYSSAMYLLTGILDEEVKKRDPKPGAVGVLRNGLVHSFMVVDPVEVKEFINKFSSVEFDFKRITLEELNLFNSLKKRDSCAKSVKVDRDNLVLSKDGKFDKEAFAKTVDTVSRSRQVEMEKQKTNMNNFRGREDFEPKIITYAKLYSAGCFCEAAEQVDILKKRIGKEPLFPDLRGIRGELVHASPSCLSKIDSIETIINAHTAAFEGKANLSANTEEKESTKNDVEETTSSSSNPKSVEEISPNQEKELTENDAQKTSSSSSSSSLKPKRKRSFVDQVSTNREKEEGEGRS